MNKSKWEILYGAGDVAVYNGVKKIFHVFPEEAEMVVKILNELEDELARCKEDRLGAEELLDECVLQFEHLNQLFAETGTTNSLLARITAFRALQQTQEVAMSNQPAPKSAEEVLKEFELDDLIYRNVIIKAMQSYASQSAPRYVPDEEIDEMWPITQGYEDENKAAKSMRDMIFNNVKPKV